MTNHLCKLLNIKYPIFQGAMTNVTDVNLVSAVSNAGGLGIFAPGIENIDLESVRTQIREIKNKTPNSFGVNIMLASRYADEIVKLVCEEKVPIVTTGAGSPEKYMKAFKEAGILVAPVVSSLELALKMERIGADILIVEGMESGGYIGNITSMVLIPQVTSVVHVPVVAAGGIADGRGLAAAFMLGAQGVQMGTMFLTTKECMIPDWCKRAIIVARPQDAIVLGDRIGAKSRLRVLNTHIVKEINEAESDSEATIDRFQSMVSEARTNQYEKGLDNTLIGLGQCIGIVNTQLTVDELINSMIEDYENIAKPSIR